MNQNQYREKKRNKIVEVLIIGSISLIITLSIQFLINRPKDSYLHRDERLYSVGSTAKENYDVGYGQDVIIFDILKEISSELKNIKSIFPEINYTSFSETNHYSPEVIWTDSPVMQTWSYDERARVWETALPYKDSFRSNPTLIFGLREDGVVVWKKKK